MKKIFFLLIILITSLSGCSVEVIEQEDQNTAETTFEKSKVEYSDWTQIDIGLNIKQFLADTQNTITVLRIDKNQYQWALAQDIKNPRIVSQWQEKLRAEIVINGSYFDENNNATGFLMIEKEKFGNLSLNGKNGYTGMLLIKDNQPELRYLPKENYKNEKVDFALQTFPTLIYNNKSLITEDSGKTARRTVLAQAKDGKTYIIISESFISLYKLAKWLENSELDINIAINLDGGPSTGLIVKDYYKSDSALIPNVIYLEAVSSRQ